MPHPDKLTFREHLPTILDQLLKAGWISEFGLHENKYAVKWTDKGKERVKLTKCSQYRASQREPAVSLRVK
jgi:hypothetical protein